MADPRDRLEKIVFRVVAVPVAGWLSLRVGWKWFRFVLWAIRDDEGTR